MNVDPEVECRVHDLLVVAAVHVQMEDGIGRSGGSAGVLKKRTCQGLELPFTAVGDVLAGGREGAGGFRADGG